MRAINELGVVIVSMGAFAALLKVFFDWRARLRDEFSGASH